MKYCYSNNGLSSRVVDDAYKPVTGEVLFNYVPSSLELKNAFSEYESSKANVLYGALYASVNAKTETLIAAGTTFTNSVGTSGTIHCDNMAQINALSFAANPDAIIAVGGTWDGSYSIPFTTEAHVTSYCTAVQTCVVSRRAEGKTLRETLSQTSSETTSAWLARLQAFVDPR